MSTPATPTPGLLRAVMASASFRLIDEDGCLVVETHLRSPEDQANAERLAHTWNTYAQLVAALEALMRNLSNIEVLGEWEALDMNARSRRELRPKVDAVIDQARLALAAARPAQKEGSSK